MFTQLVKEPSPTIQAQSIMQVSLENEAIVDEAVNGDVTPWKNALLEAGNRQLTRNIIPVLECYLMDSKMRELRRYNGNDPEGWQMLCTIDEDTFGTLPKEAKFFEDEEVDNIILYNSAYNVVKKMVLPKLVKLYSKVHETLGNHEPDAAEELFKEVNELDGYFDEYVASACPLNVYPVVETNTPVTYEKFKDIMKVMADAYMENPDLDGDMLDFMQMMQTAIASSITIAKYLKENDAVEVGAYKTTLIRMAKIIQSTNNFLSVYVMRRIENMNKRAKCFG